jgi:hypothetical protein
MKTKQFFFICSNIYPCALIKQKISAFFKKNRFQGIKKNPYFQLELNYFPYQSKDMQNSNLFNYLLIKIKKNIFSQLK